MRGKKVLLASQVCDSRVNRTLEFIRDYLPYSERELCAKPLSQLIDLNDRACLAAERQAAAYAKQKTS